MQENRYCKSLLIWKLEEVISKECNSLDVFKFFFGRLVGSGITLYVYPCYVTNFSCTSLKRVFLKDRSIWMDYDDVRRPFNCRLLCLPFPTSITFDTDWFFSCWNKDALVAALSFRVRRGWEGRKGGTWSSPWSRLVWVCIAGNIGH